MSRILIYGSNPRLESGMGKVGLEMARQLAAEHEVHYFAPNAIGPRREYPPDADERTFVLYGRPSVGGPGIGMFSHRLAEVDPDIVLTNRNWQSLDWMANTLNDRYMNQARPTPLLFYGPPIEAEVRPPLFENTLLEDHLNEVYIVPYTGNRYEAMRNDWELEQYMLPPDREGAWVPHGVDLDVFHPEATKAREDVPGIRAGLGLGNRYIVTMVGENWRRKNLDLLLDAWGDFRDRLLDEGEQRPFLLLHVDPAASRGDDDFYAGWDIIKTAFGYGLNIATDMTAVNDEADVVTTKRYIGAFDPREVVAAHYATADLMCLPTAGEGFSLTTLEAMACGCPILQTDVPTLRWLSGEASEYIDVVQDHAINSGERHATPSVTDMADKLYDLYHDGARRLAMSEAGVERAAEFPWSRLGDGLNDAIAYIEEQE